jgi:hypothetical protein
MILGLAIFGLENCGDVKEKNQYETNDKKDNHCFNLASHSTLGGNNASTHPQSNYSSSLRGTLVSIGIFTAESNILGLSKCMRREEIMGDRYTHLHQKKKPRTTKKERERRRRKQNEQLVGDKN